jgi:hypothetical protein
MQKEEPTVEGEGVHQKTTTLDFLYSPFYLKTEEDPSSKTLFFFGGGG